MKKVHIVFFGVPHPAHANATYSIVSALVRRGYRITYTTNEKFAARVQSLGATALISRSWTVPESERQPWLADPARLKVPNWDLICLINTRLLREVKASLRKDRPDVIIYDLVAFAGRVLANQWNVPAIQISPHCALDEHGIASQVRDPELRDHLLERGENVADFFDRHGLSGNNWLFHREELNIHFIPKVFQPDGAALLDDRCFFAGRCAIERPLDDHWQKTHHSDRPIALVTGSMTYVRDPDYFRVCLDALSGLHWHVVLVIGNSNERASLRALPAHAEVVQYVDNVKVLPHASLLICQGGNMSTTEAAFYGVPVVAATFGFAELAWCAETSIIRLGLGKHLRQDPIDEVIIRQASMEIAEDTGMRRNLNRVRELVQHDPGAEGVADRIGQHLATRLQVPNG